MREGEGRGEGGWSGEDRRGEDARANGAAGKSGNEGYRAASVGAQEGRGVGCSATPGQKPPSLYHFAIRSLSSGDESADSDQSGTASEDEIGDVDSEGPVTSGDEDENGHERGRGRALGGWDSTGGLKDGQGKDAGGRVAVTGGSGKVSSARGGRNDGGGAEERGGGRGDRRQVHGGGNVGALLHGNAGAPARRDNGDGAGPRDGEATGRPDSAGGGRPTSGGAARLSVMEYTLRLCMLELQEDCPHWKVKDEKVAAFFAEERLTAMTSVTAHSQKPPSSSTPLTPLSARRRSSPAFGTPTRLGLPITTPPPFRLHTPQQQLTPGARGRSASGRTTLVDGLRHLSIS